MALSTRRGHRPAPIPARLAGLLADAPIHAVDVGAARGLPPHWEPFIDILRIHAFEPRPDECARLAAGSHPHIRWHPVALAGRIGPRKLHVTATPTGSSLLPPDPRFAALYSTPEYFEVVEVADVDCTTLAHQLDEVGAPGPMLIKLDTQGTELEILEGLGDRRREQVVAVEVEAELHEAYTGQPLFGDVHHAMTAWGFELFDVRAQRAHLTGGVEELHYLRRHLGTAVGTRSLAAKLHAVDALYVRSFTGPHPVASPEALARYLTVLQIYRFLDVSFWLLDRPEVVDLVGQQGRAELQAAYARSAPRPRPGQRTGALPHLWRRGRRAASLVLEALGAEGFDPPHVAWSRARWPDA